GGRDRGQAGDERERNESNLVELHVRILSPLLRAVDRAVDGDAVMTRSLGAYSTQGARFGRSTHRFASSSPTICSRTGSNLNARPVQKAMLARWQVATVR